MVDQTYLVLVSYLVPVEGTLVVPGTSEDDVRTKATELFQNRINLNIVSVMCLGDSDQQETPQDDTTNVIIFDPNKKKKHNDQDSFPDR